VTSAEPGSPEEGTTTFPTLQTTTTIWKSVAAWSLLLAVWLAVAIIFSIEEDWIFFAAAVLSVLTSLLAILLRVIVVKPITRTSRLSVRVHGDAESVVRWWTDPQRRSERRSRFEAGKFAEASWREEQVGDTLVVHMAWTKKRGRQVQVQTIALSNHDGQIGQTEIGFQLQGTVHQTCHHPDGRQHAFETHSTFVFRERQPGSTTISQTTTITRLGSSVVEIAWSYVSPAFRQGLMKQLRSNVSLCEVALAETASQPSSTP
jgi:hypothetical protein